MALTTEEGSAFVFIAVDHCTSECTGIHASTSGSRHEALEPIRQGVRASFGRYDQDCTSGLSLRHDHGSQYMSCGACLCSDGPLLSTSDDRATRPPEN